ncbi:hypothetical protein ACIPVB_13985 [Microbacterium sp. NPDC090007]|uniref:Pepco domain-containing protein n=1 Tax=Microbacterium sp. NPDC090007 TaxID=3364204 RepID=UPI003827A8E6
MPDDWSVEIYAPRQTPGVAPTGGEIVEASVDALRESWHDTIEKLTAVVDGIDDDISTWGVNQVEVGLTLSAKGQLLFIAQAGAEATVKITLTRRQP